MLKYPCLVLDHDDTVVQSESTVNYPYFCYILNQFRPGQTIAWEEYVHGCSKMGFVEMCRQKYHFTESELTEEFNGWVDYIRSHTPPPFSGIAEIIHQQKASGGLICVVSHSGTENIMRDYRQHFGILPDDIYGWDLPAYQRKPSTYPLDQIMKKYGLLPKDLLVVDDMQPAWKMVTDAGVACAFASWSKTDMPEIATAMTKLCKYTFNSPKELAKFLFD